MIIGIDGNEANVENKVGVSMYTFNLLKEFYKSASATTQFVIYLRNAPGDDLPSENEYFKYHVVAGPFAWSQLFFPLYLYTHKRPDVLFCPAHYIPRFCPVKTVVTIHDVAYFYYPDEFLKEDLYKLKNWTLYALNKSVKVISVSENTKNDIVKFYHTPENKIEVIHNGFNKLDSQESTVESKIKGKYLLYVGTLQPRKNISKLIDAFVLLKKEHADLSLVLVGKKGWLYDEIFNKVDRLGLSNSILFTGYVSDEERNSLYQHASVFILPSLYEGFGNPPLEAMSAGIPVAVSNNSSLPEICGDACVYFNPNDTIDIAKKVSNVLTDAKLRSELVEKGKKQIKKFSWHQCAQETLRVLQSA